MKNLFENWKSFLNEEQLLTEQIDKDFMLLSESLTEWQKKGLLEEGIAQEFLGGVKKFSRWKNEKLATWLEAALKKLKDLAFTLRKSGALDFKLGKRLAAFIGKLMRPDNLILAASIISIVAGLLMGDVASNVASLSSLLDAVDASASLVDAAKMIADAQDIKAAIEAGMKGADIVGNVGGGAQ